MHDVAGWRTMYLVKEGLRGPPRRRNCYGRNARGEDCGRVPLAALKSALSALEAVSYASYSVCTCGVTE